MSLFGGIGCWCFHISSVWCFSSAVRDGLISIGGVVVLVVLGNELG